MSDFEQIILLPYEKRLLRKFNVSKQIPKDSIAKDYKTLLHYGLIKQNYSGEKNHIGEQIPNGTLSLSDFGNRYKEYLKKQRKRSFYYPMLIAFFTALVTEAVTKIVTYLINSL